MTTIFRPVATRTTATALLCAGLLARPALAAPPSPTTSPSTSPSTATPTPPSPSPPSSVGTSGAPPSPKAIEEGRVRFTRGVELFRDNDYPAALVEFRRAYDVAPSWRILYNIGQSYLQLQDYASALDALQRYLKEGGDQIPAPRVAEVQADLGRLRERVGSLRFTINVESAEISVDDVSVGLAPMPKPLVVNAGRRRVSAAASGRTTVVAVVDVGVGEEVEVPLKFVIPAPAPTPTAPPVRPPSHDEAPARASSSMAPVWISAGITGGLLLATAGFGVLTISNNRTLDDRLNSFPGDRAAIADARSNVHTMSLVTDLLGAATLAGGAVTFYLALSRRSAPSVTAGLGPSKLWVGGAF